MAEKLRIFVSGKEGELDNERAVVLDLIRFLDFEPIGSEKRPASDESMKNENLNEVNTSDIYIGIFGNIFSKASIDEFRNARMRNITTLIFEKESASNETRDEQLTKFLSEIKDPKTGLVVDTYKTVLDLKDSVISALSNSLTKKFRDAKRLQNKTREEENEKENEDMFKLLKEHQSNITLYEKMQKFPFTVRFSKEFGKAKFVNFKIISILKKNDRHVVSAKIEGLVNNGFLDLAIRDPDGTYYWFPEPQSYDSSTDSGKLCFNDSRRYEANWEFSLPDKSGKYLAIMGLYENDYTRRELVNFELEEFTLT